MRASSRRQPTACSRIGRDIAHAPDKPNVAARQSDKAVGAKVINDNEPAMKGMLGADFHDIIPPIGAEIHSRFIKA